MIEEALFGWNESLLSCMSLASSSFVLFAMSFATYLLKLNKIQSLMALNLFMLVLTQGMCWWKQFGFGKGLRRLDGMSFHFPVKLCLGSNKVHEKVVTTSRIEEKAPWSLKGSSLWSFRFFSYFEPRLILGSAYGHHPCKGLSHHQPLTSELNLSHCLIVVA